MGDNDPPCAKRQNGRGGATELDLQHIELLFYRQLLCSYSNDDTTTVAGPDLPCVIEIFGVVATAGVADCDARVFCTTFFAAMALRALRPAHQRRRLWIEVVFGERIGETGRPMIGYM
jgi:hypothetical protein